MAPNRFDIPLQYKPLVGDNPNEWIKKLMAKQKRKTERPVGLYTIPHYFRPIFTQAVGISGDEAHRFPSSCEFTEAETWFPDPRKLARCMISKPVLSRMGEDEEKVYCGMIYGPEYSSYEQKANARVAETIRKTLVKHLPIIITILEKNREDNLIEIRRECANWLERGKLETIKETEEIFIKIEEEFHNEIKLGRRNALLEKMGDMEREMKEVNQIKKEYLKRSYEFQMSRSLKDNEQQYLRRFNIYASIWNKILYKLQIKANEKIALLNRLVNQQIGENTLKEIKDSLEHEYNKTVIKFKNQVERNVKKLKGKIFSEEFYIVLEKRKMEQLKKTIDVWKSLLENVITLFDKIIVSGFKGKPGECNYFLTQNILKTLRMFPDKSNGAKDSEKSVHKWLINILERVYETKEEIEIKDKVDEKNVVNLSPEKSQLEIDMSVTQPNKDLIFKLHLFKLKKLMEETTCLILNKPFRILDSMEDKSVEIKPFQEGDVEDLTYVLNRLSDAHHIIDKMLIERRTFTTNFKRNSGVENVPFTIETDPELTKRMNSLIKLYKRNPDHIRGLTNV